MTTYYFTETNDRKAYRQAEALKAKTLADAKREATRRQVFYGTVLKIGTIYSLNANGLLVSEISYKDGDKWTDTI
ncbi:hypothetical protein A6046_03435 [[Haemophilus] ducreyi]|uniref:Uncharacterized protein n=2 Tax=Haemophilus ducreyi TaxID=730 RepID=Q7VPC9_HAEDU|nr:hypothetical protein [[Haemophilus] ducreyi]AAP95152.1 hypothetical protein HD_0157 [[Haemophilus] ducreyi 35000HP]AKO30315.1 hypothetical protein RY60_00585 [[Haemophilus] ducreyi]AKO31748.1 hypothetical protein RZ57_00590 [[Haemophilus] ducreyi]AKO33201.1 hypothetical protein RZ58_00590 [[Haemophilus] ducreyi]AKO34650.1 hypothetical protein RZ59_00585 [[Haemophilus] ducreyi]